MRRRHKRLIILLLIFSLTLTLAYLRREKIFLQAKNLLIQNLEKRVPFDLSIGTIKAGIFYGLVLENLEIDFPQISNLGFRVNVEQAFVDYNLWQEVLSRGFRKDADKSRQMKKLRLVSPTINITYSANFKDVSKMQFSSAEGEGPIYNSREISTKLINGDFNAVNWMAEENFVLELEGGGISFNNTLPLLKNLEGKIHLTTEGVIFEDVSANCLDNLKNALKFYGELSSDQLSLTASLRDVRIGDFDLLTNLNLTLERSRGLENTEQKVVGTLKTYGTILNNQPFPELNSTFEIQDEKLRILTFSLGDNYDLRGIVSLSGPNNANLSLNFYQATPHTLLSLFTFPSEPDFSGLVNGLIKITGPLKRPKIEGYIEAKQGHMGDLIFESADINLKGRMPRITITDSRFFREEDYFIMEGEIDFSLFRWQNFIDIRFKTDKSIIWQGWDISRGSRNQVHVSRNVADDFKITFDSFLEQKPSDFEDNYINELGLEYRVFGDKALKLRLKKNEGILGVEQRVKF